MFTLMHSFGAKYIFWAKKYRWVIFHDTEEWYKIWRGIDLLFQSWHGKFNEFWPKPLKVSKISTLMCSFWAKYIFFELKKYRGVIFHDTEEWYKIWRKTDLWCGKWHDEYGKFSAEHLKVSKLGLWWDPLIQSSKCMSLKFPEELLCIMKMNNDAKFEEQLTCCFKLNREFDEFWPEHLKVSKIFILIHSFGAKYMFWAKKYRGVIFHDTEEWYKIWRGIDLSFQSWHGKFDEFWPKHFKVSKIFPLMGSFWVKYILFELKNTEELSFMTLKSDTKLGEELTCCFKIDMRNLTNFDLSTWKFQKSSL